MKTTLYYFGLFILISVVSCSKKQTIAEFDQVIPLPQEVHLNKESQGFILNKKTNIVYTKGNETQERTAHFLAEYIQFATGLELNINTKEDQENVIILQTGYQGKPESYSIEISENRIVINGADEAGIFYGVQTLRKSIPLDTKDKHILFPAGNIKDYPRFAYRGMHLDVARHIFTIDFIKRYIDLLALHNINTFHWHLTDDQGWRIEIKKHPELTKVGSVRAQTVVGKTVSEYDNTPHGGFYTQEEIKEIVNYAANRFITVIPEIDIPGHTSAVLAAYPHLGCTGGPYKVGEVWGVYDDVLCAGNEAVFSFLEDVFSEIIDLFPSEYIHIGGDECPKVRWEKCPKCQDKIVQLGLRNDQNHAPEFKLQSYFVQRIEAFLNSKGRKVIGWDEILEGGLAPNATIMSWRGISGGIQAAKEHHDVIMTPDSHCYFNFYPTMDTDKEPLAGGFYLPLERVYSFDPVPDELNGEEKKHIIGVQANLWTEYITTPEQAEYMVLPRMTALSEVQWTEPEKKDYQHFLTRAYRMIRFYKKLGYNFGTHAFDIQPEIEAIPDKKILEVSLTNFDNAPIHYTLDGTTPSEKSTLYEKPIEISSSGELRATIIRPEVNSKEYSRTFDFNEATFSKIDLEASLHPRYTYEGAVTLVDGKRGGKAHNNGEWLGIYNSDLVATIDLEETKSISEVRLGTLWIASSWIFGAKSYTVYISQDGDTFQEVYREEYPILTGESPSGVTVDLIALFEKQAARYVKIIAESTQPIPDWHGGKGNPSFLFVDEITIK